MKKKALIAIFFAILIVGLFIISQIWPDATTYIVTASLAAVVITAFTFLVGALMIVVASNIRAQIEQNMN